MKPFKVEKPEHVSDFAKDFNFESLRPFYDNEVKGVMERMSKDPTYHALINHLWPGISPEQAVQKALNTKSIRDFQIGFMADAIWQIVKNSSNGLTYNGIENLDKNSAYLFIANHRDILLDSALLQIILDKEEFETSEITFGNNLNADGFITDFGKMNRMFPIKRDGNTKELYYVSQQLSAYLRHTILDKKTSVWIAQRNGRTKDGNDLTQTGVLKMLSLSGNRSFIETFSELNIVPLTISYEYEPCDDLKVNELYQLAQNGSYTKATGEDLNNIITGIKQPKGKIHISFGKPIRNELIEIDKAKNENEKIKLLAAHIDRVIIGDYKLLNTNFIAYDILNNTKYFDSKYIKEEIENFKNYVETKISKLKGEPTILREMFYKMYAFPVINALALKKEKSTSL